MRRARAGIPTARLALVWSALVWSALGCGDRSPPAMWPEAPPPTLAVPIGVSDPQRSGDRPIPPATVESAKPEPAKPEPAKPKSP